MQLFLLFPTKIMIKHYTLTRSSAAIQREGNFILFSFDDPSAVFSAGKLVIHNKSYKKRKSIAIHVDSFKALIRSKNFKIASEDFGELQLEDPQDRHDQHETE